MYFDYYYLILVVPALLFAMWAQKKVKSAFNQYSNASTYSRMTGFEAARRILDAHGLRNVQIEMIDGDLTDHYDPGANVIRLSQRVFSSDSISAIGVAAHEAGHAVQYAEGYIPVKIRSAIIPVCQFGSSISWPMVFIGFVLGSSKLVNLGLILFSLVVVFQLVTLPVEFNASSRAIDCLGQGGLMTGEELYDVKKVLDAAALTYVAALAVSVANLLRMVLIFGGRNGRDRRR